MSYIKIKHNSGNTHLCKFLGGTSVHVRGQYRPSWLRVSTPQTGMTFITHHQVMMGEQAGTLPAKTYKHVTPSLHTDILLTPSSPSDVVLPSPSLPPFSLSLLLALWQSWHYEKFRAVRGNVRRLRRTICQTHTLTRCHTLTFMRFNLEKLRDVWHNSVYNQKQLFKMDVGY